LKLIDVVVRKHRYVEERGARERREEEARRAEIPKTSNKSNVLRVSERKAASLRREHPMVNSNNDIIQYFIPSDMDVKVLLRDSDVRGALFYILNNTKTKITRMPL